MPFGWKPRGLFRIVHGAAIFWVESSEPWWSWNVVLATILSWLPSGQVVLRGGSSYNLEPKICARAMEFSCNVTPGCPCSLRILVCYPTQTTIRVHANEEIEKFTNLHKRRSEPTRRKQIRLGRLGPSAEVGRSKLGTMEMLNKLQVRTSGRTERQISWIDRSLDPLGYNYCHPKWGWSLREGFENLRVITQSTQRKGFDTLLACENISAIVAHNNSSDFFQLRSFLLDSVFSFRFVSNCNFPWSPRFLRLIRIFPPRVLLTPLDWKY